MLAKELKKKYLKKNMRDDVGVIAIGEDFWYHIHDNEEIPEIYYPGADGSKEKKPLTIAMHPRLGVGKCIHNTPLKDRCGTCEHEVSLIAGSPDERYTFEVKK